VGSIFDTGNIKITLHRVQIPTCILVLRNLFTESELTIDEEFEEIEEDVKMECEKFGKVIKIVMPRPA
jgi:hypothetical protein